MGKPVTAARLPFTQITFAADVQSFSFDSDLKRWTCDVQGKQCTSADRPATVPNSELSPDGKRAAFIRDCNLWVRDVATGQETQLTTDGVKDFGYATDNAGWTQQRSRRSSSWSPDSKKIATFQQDQRSVGEMYLVSTDGRPSDAAGVEVSAARRRDRHDDPARRHRRRRGQGRCACKMPPDQHRSTLCDDVVLRRRLGRRAVEPGRQPASRSSRPRAITSRRQLRVADAATGAMREVLEEKVDDVLRVGQRPRQLALPAGVERSDLVLASATTGASSISTICRPAS